MQRFRIVPVKQRDPWLDSGSEQRIHQSIIKIEAARVERTHAIGNHARPGDGESIGAYTQIAHQRDVVTPTIEVIASDFTRGAITDRARPFAKGIPDRHTAAGSRRGSFDLVGRGRGAPHEVAAEIAAQSGCAARHRTSDGCGAQCKECAPIDAMTIVAGVGCLHAANALRECSVIGRKCIAGIERGLAVPVDSSAAERRAALVSMIHSKSPLVREAGAIIRRTTQTSRLQPHLSAPVARGATLIHANPGNAASAKAPRSIPMASPLATAQP